MANEPIIVPEAISLIGSFPVATNNDATHFVVPGENALELYSYHFDNNEWTRVELESSFKSGYIQEVAFVVDDVLYIGGSQLKLYAYDLATGKELYKGNIKSESDAQFHFSLSGVK